MRYVFKLPIWLLLGYFILYLTIYKNIIFFLSGIKPYNGFEDQVVCDYTFIIKKINIRNDYDIMRIAQNYF